MSWAATAARIAAVTSARLGNAVTIGAVSGYGILLEPTEELIGGEIISTDATVELPVAVFGTPLENTAIVADGTAYVARADGRLAADGATVIVPLRRS